MESITQFITQKLKLKVNEAKSAVARPQERKFLGLSFTAGPEVKRVIAPKALDRFKRRIRGITRRAKGVSMETTMEELAPYMRGWRSYFGFCETPEVLIGLTRWVRLRLRAALWWQWKVSFRQACHNVTCFSVKISEARRMRALDSPERIGCRVSAGENRKGVAGGFAGWRILNHEKRWEAEKPYIRI